MTLVVWFLVMNRSSTHTMTRISLSFCLRKVKILIVNAFNHILNFKVGFNPFEPTSKLGVFG